MLRTAAREGYKATLPSFDGLIVRTERQSRALREAEQKQASDVYSRWMARIQEFAIETGLSQGDILWLTVDVIDRERGFIKPEGGRKKTSVPQVSPLTARAKAILDEIRAEKKSGQTVANVAGLIFTRADGWPITKDMIHSQIEKAIRAGVKKFKFHDTRNTALTQWRRRNISVDAVMRAGGWSSTQIYKRYLDMSEDDVAAAFGASGSSPNGNRNGNKKVGTRRAASATT